MSLLALPYLYNELPFERMRIAQPQGRLPSPCGRRAPEMAWKPAECDFRRLGELQTRQVADQATRLLSGIWEVVSRVSLRLKAGPGVTKVLDKAIWYEYERCGCLAKVTQILLRRGSGERPAA